MQPKKSLGQNFLKSEGDLLAIVAAGNLTPDDFVLEIGPGQGALTTKILATGATMMAIEKDDELIPFLEKKFEKEISEGRFKLICGDVLEKDLSDKIPLKYKLISNIPYYITGQIIRKFLSAQNQPEEMVLLVQKEVAERIIARDGKESILSISVKAYSQPELIKIVKAGSFFPRPSVSSAVIAFRKINKEMFNGISEDKFFDVLHAGFAHKRKRLFSNLKQKFETFNEEKMINNCDLDINIRAEKLTPSNWVEAVKVLDK